MKAILLILATAALTSCEQLKSFVIANEGTITTAVAEAARIGATAGIQQLKKDAKNPNPVPVQPD